MQKLARTKQFVTPADGHYHFFRLASPNGADQTSRCTSNKKLGIRGCGLEKSHSNVIQFGGFGDFSMESTQL